MASTRLTKTNIDRELLVLLQTIADAQGITTPVLFEKMTLYYLKGNLDVTAAPATSA